VASTVAPREHSGALYRGAVVVAVAIAIGWSVAAVLVGWFSAPDPFSRTILLVLSTIPGLVVLGILTSGWNRSRTGRLPRGTGRMAAIAIAASLIVYLASWNNLAMRARVAMHATQMTDEVEQLLRDPRGRPAPFGQPAHSLRLGTFDVRGVEPDDCGGPSDGVGAEAWFAGGESETTARHGPRAGLRPRLLYCPRGIEPGQVGDKYADVEHLVGPWWIDWQDG